MSGNDETHGDDDINAAVYGGLLLLTAATLTAGTIAHGGRLMAIAIAVIIASVKASLIGFYYMGLRRERLLTWVLIGIGTLALAVLLAGIFPDLTFRRL